MFTESHYRDRKPIGGCIRLWLRLGVDTNDHEVFLVEMKLFLSWWLWLHNCIYLYYVWFIWTFQNSEMRVNISFFFLLLFKYSYLHFSPSTFSTPPIPTSQPQSYPTMALSRGPFHTFLDDPSPSFPHYLPSLFPLVIVSLFFISMSLVIFWLLICFLD